MRVRYNEIRLKKKYVEKSCRRNPVEEFMSKIISAGISDAILDAPLARQVGSELKNVICFDDKHK